MLLLYRGFVRAYLRVAVIPARVDHVQGGFYVYRILPWPERGPALVYDLPGAEGLLADAMTLQHAGDAAAAAREVARLGRLLPDVCHLRNVIGYSFREAGRWDGAYRMYAPGIRAGMVDDENWSGFAAAAAGLGKTDEALVAARRAWELYPAWRGDTDRLLANLEHDRGERALRGGRLAEAEAAYTACLESLARLPRTVDFENATLYASVRLSEALARQGRKREAKERLDAAALVRPALLRTAEARAVLRLIGDKP
jgi:tetratricopeptide (TPR) repeat protein